MNLSETEGIEKKTFVVTGGLGFVGSTLCFELVRRGAQQVRAFDVRPESPWSHDLRNRGVHCIQVVMDSPSKFTSLMVATAFGSLLCAAFMPDHIGPVPHLRAFFLSILRSTSLLKGVALSILAAHVFEGFYAWKLAKKVDPQNALAWGCQTFVLGFFSLRLLEKRAKAQ